MTPDQPRTSGERAYAYYQYRQAGHSLLEALVLADLDFDVEEVEA